MDCRTFERWLDAGRPSELREPATRHAEACARCRAELVAARELDAALSQRFATAPPSFTDRVLERVTARSARPAVVPRELEPVFPWWIRIFQDPATILSFLLAAAFLGWGADLWEVVRTIGSGALGLASPIAHLSPLGNAPGLGWLTIGLTLWGAAAIALYRGAARWGDHL